MLDRVAKEKREKHDGPHDDSQSEGAAQAIGPDKRLITARQAPLWSTRGDLERTSPFVKKKFEFVTTLNAQSARAAPGRSRLAPSRAARVSPSQTCSILAVRVRGGGGDGEERERDRRLRIELQSVRQGNRWTEKWIGTIEPRPTAGMTNIPTVLMGRDGYTLTFTGRGKRRTVPCRTPGSSATAPWSSLP